MDSSVVLMAHWHHPVNMIEFVLPSIHLSVQRKRQIDRFSRSCTAQCRNYLYFYNGRFFPRNCPSPWGDLDPHLIHGSWAQPSPQPKRHLNQFSHFAGLTSVTERPTDHATRSVTIDHIYVHSMLVS